MRSFGSHYNGIQPRHRAPTYQTGRRIHLNILYPLQADVIRQIRAALFDDYTSPRPYSHFFSPAVNHGKGQLAAFFDKKLTNANMHALAHMRVSAAASNNVQLRPFFDNNHVMHVLHYFFRADVHAGLHGVLHLDARQRPNKVAMFLMHRRPGGIFIRVRRYRPPPILFFQPVVALQSLIDAHDFQTVPLHLTMRYRMVGL